MTLFELDETDYTVKLNKVWIRLIPEFDFIMKKDTGGVKDYEGRKKLWARKRFAFIFFYLDFKSPIYNWDDDKRETESLKYSGLTAKEIKEDYMEAAINAYLVLQEGASRSLKTLRSVNKGLAALDSYFEEINFKKVDKMGKVLYTASDYVKNISMLNKAYDELNRFEKRVMAELTDKGGIRGQATKGDREERRLSNVAVDGWSEGGAPEDKAPRFIDLNTGQEPTEDIFN